MNDPTPKLVITKQQQKKSSSHVLLFKAISHTKSERNRHLSSLLCCCMQLFLHAELICSMERREIGMGGDEKGSALSIHPFPFPLYQGRCAQ